MWDSGEQTSTITTGAGIHSVVVKDSKDCSANTNINLETIPELLVVNIQLNDAPCVGVEGSVEISVSGGTGVINFEWPNVTSTANTQALLADDYTINIDDANGCTTEAIFTVNETDSLEFSVSSVTDATCYQFNDGQIELQISGGTASYSIEFEGTNNLPYQFSNISSNPTTLANFQADDYNVLITDANGCTNENYIFNVSVGEPTDIVVTDTIITNVTCFGNSTGSIQTNVSGGTEVYTYVWTDSTNTIISTNDSINDVVAGTYTFTVNDGNCEKLFSFEISQPSFIYLANKPDANNVSCFGLNDGFISNTFPQGGVASL